MLAIAGGFGTSTESALSERPSGGSVSLTSLQPPSHNFINSILFDPFEGNRHVRSFNGSRI